MTTFKSDLLNTLSERGLINQSSDIDGLDQLLQTTSVTLYQGFDCTAPSLHIGNLIGIMVLRWSQKSGHKPIALLGGGTTKVGDPAGKNSARPLLDERQIAANKASISKVFARFIRFDAGDSNSALMLDNSEWLTNINLLDFLRDVGRNFSINRMLTFDMVKSRIENQDNLSYLEFSYMLLQAYDFVELNKRYDCRLQFGGADQWGNIVSGIDLGRRMNNARLFGLTCPLLTNSSGQKMGKTAAGAVWLDGDMLSPYEYWQFWRNCDDGDVGKLLKLFTELPMDEIVRLEKLGDSEINHAKEILATEATTLLHGSEAAQKAMATARATFAGGGNNGKDGERRDDNLPSIMIAMNELRAGLGLLNALVRVELVSSNSDARRQIKGNGIRINDTVVTDEKYRLTPDDIISGSIKLSLGKKRHILIKTD